ncbi:MAG: DUF427 domain-containing protein [Acidimicrobiales bacterium]
MSLNEVRVEPNPKWIRGVKSGRTVVDTRSAKYVWTHPYYPAWYIPIEDVTAAGLATTTVDELPGHVHIDWGEMDSWFEEDEEVFVHPRDPYKRIDALRSSRVVRVLLDGEVIAETEKPTVLYESMLPPRYYIPATDVRLDLLTPTTTETACPYKGWAHYWTATINDVEYTDVAWGYRTPLPESQPIAGMVCFYNDRVDLEVDGELVD